MQIATHRPVRGKKQLAARTRRPCSPIGRAPRVSAVARVGAGDRVPIAGGPAAKPRKLR